MRMIYAMMLAALMALTGISAPAGAQTAQPEIEILSLQAHPSDVDIGNARAWSRINVDPFRGSVDQASLVLNPKTNIRPFEYHEAFAMRTRGECHRYQFGPTDQFRTTFGRDRSMLANPGFTGWADVCIVRADGSAVIFPDGCTNIGPGLAVIRRQETAITISVNQSIAPPTFTVTVSQAQEADVQAFPYFGWAPAPRYSAGNQNIIVGQRLDSTSTSTSGSPGCPTACGGHAPRQPGHISGE
jgi:hypothetical protein